MRVYIAFLNIDYECQHKLCLLQNLYYHVNLSSPKTHLKKFDFKSPENILIGSNVKLRNFSLVVNIGRLSFKFKVTSFANEWHINETMKIIPIPIFNY